MDTDALIQALNFQRLAGTSGEENAVKRIGQCLDDLGLEWETESFDFMGFDTTTGEIQSRDGTWPCHPFGLSDTQTLTGPLAVVENPKALEHTLSAHEGEIVLSYGSRPNLQKALAANGAAGFISVGPPHSPAMAMGHKQWEYAKGVVPSVSVDHETGLALLDLEGRDITLTLRQQVGSRTGKNLIVRIPGTGPDQALTLLSAHYDTVARSPGSNDNAGGVITLLKTLAYFKAHPPQRELRAIFFSGEEFGFLGSFDYVRRHSKELESRARLVINVDGAGDALGLNKYFIMGSRELAGYVDGISRELGLVFQINLDPFNSDGIPFARAGIPSINIEKCLGKGSFFYHTPADTADHTSPRGLAAPIQAATGLLERILNSRVYPVDKTIDPALATRIDKIARSYQG